MEKKAPQIFFKNPEKQAPQGNLRFYILQTLLSQDAPITITGLCALLKAQDIFFNRDSIRRAMNEMERFPGLLPQYTLTKTTVRAGDSRAAAYHLSINSQCSDKSEKK